MSDSVLAWQPRWVQCHEIMPPFSVFFVLFFVVNKVVNSYTPCFALGDEVNPNTISGDIIGYTCFLRSVMVMVMVDVQYFIGNIINLHKSFASFPIFLASPCCVFVIYMVPILYSLYPSTVTYVLS